MMPTDVEPTDSETDDRPLYSRRRTTVIRVIVLIAVGAMLLPVLVNLVAVNTMAAQSACAAAAAYETPDATGSSARFEIFGAGGIGWECYSVGGFTGAKHILSLGIIPGVVEIPRGVHT